jgi:tetratricopeptide (TPR) repeat protein
MNQQRDLQPGDVITRSDTAGWHSVKLLAVDPWPDGTAVAHCLIYNILPDKPTVGSLKHAKITIWHAPIDAGSFKDGWELLGNEPPTNAELSGFVEYLKLTNFPRYVQFTGQDSKAIIRAAQEHYQRAYALGDQGKRAEAITEYSAAIDVFPLFYEAVDNRGLTYMELGELRQAIADFEASLRINPDGVTAFFSRGECLMKLGDLAAAEAIFAEGQTRFPEQRATFETFLNHVRALRTGA